MDIYFDNKLNSQARKILIAIEDYLRMYPEKSFSDAMIDLNIGKEKLGDDSAVLNRIGSSLFGMLVTRQ